MNLDLILHAIEACAVLPIAWKVNRVLNRYLDVFKDHPPHRHINGKILYPKGFEPPQVQTLGYRE